jgi:large subunit ribosomal protein L23
MNSIITKPIITEKSMQQVSRGWYTFATISHAHKETIAKAINLMYNVTVRKIRSVSQHGKARKAGKKMKLVNRPDWKKVYVKLAKGQTIAAFETTQQSAESK